MSEGKKEDDDAVWIPTQRQERGCYEKVGVHRLHPCELAHPPASSPSRDLINADALQWRPTCIASSSLSKLNPRSLLERPPQPTFQICCCCCYCFNYIKTILFVSTLFLFYCYVCAYFLKKWCFFSCATLSHCLLVLVCVGSYLCRGNTTTFVTTRPTRSRIF